MNKILPFIFPVLSLILVLFLAFRWHYVQKERINNNYCTPRECQCIEDCEISNESTRRYISGYKSPDQCICLIENEVKNIW